jgi:hypothetical protein
MQTSSSCAIEGEKCSPSGIKRDKFSFQDELNIPRDKNSLQEESNIPRMGVVCQEEKIRRKNHKTIDYTRRFVEFTFSF